MPSPTIVIAQKDSTIARELTSDLHAHFARVSVAHDTTELRTLLLRQQARIAVLDLELVSLEEVHHLALSFGGLTIICTHRSPDERMWMAALNAGAVEFCHPLDISSILRAHRETEKHRVATAA